MDLDLIADDVIPSPLNRPVGLDDVKELLPSVERDGQLQPGTVRPHPTQPGKYECIIGHRRLMCCRILGRKFLARVVTEPLTDADVIRMMLAENVNREDMTWFQIAEKVEQFIKASGCKQGQAAELLSLDESLVSKALTVSQNLAPELADAPIGKTSLYLIATIPDHARQKALAQRVIEQGLKRDAVARLVKEMKGKPGAKDKPSKARDGDVTIEYPVTTTWDAIDVLGAKLQKAAAQGKKSPVPVSPAMVLQKLLVG